MNLLPDKERYVLSAIGAGLWVLVNMLWGVLVFAPLFLVFGDPLPVWIAALASVVWLAGQAGLWVITDRVRERVQPRIDDRLGPVLFGEVPTDA